MVENQFESLGQLEDLDESTQPAADSLYELSPLALRTRRFSFILFEEIVKTSPAQSREVIFDPERIPEDRQLLESVRLQGILEPILVRELTGDQDPEDSRSPLFSGTKHGERQFALIAGQRRLEAGKAAGLKGVEGIITEEEHDHELITLAENMGRRELTTYERALAIGSLKEERGLSIRKTGELTGLSIGHISRLLSSLDAPQPLLELWKTGELKVTILESLKPHWDQFDRPLAKTALDILQEMTRGQARDLCAQLTAGNDLETALQALAGIQTLQKPASETDPEPPGRRTGPKRRTRNKSNSPEKELQSGQKKAIIKAIRNVFPGLTHRQVSRLFHQAAGSTTLDADLLWGAALYTSRGGDPDNAVALTAAAVGDRRIKSLLAREVQQRKKAASLLQQLDGKDPDTRQLIRTIFKGS